MSTGDLFGEPTTDAPPTNPNVVTIRVLGTPAPKGSKKAFVVGKVVPRAVVVDDNAPKAKLWAGLVAEAASKAMEGRRLFTGVPLSVHATFILARPSGHYTPRGVLTKSAPRFPCVKPDLDKLLRSTMDALEGRVFDGDSRIVTIVATKVYAAGASPGALIQVREETGA
jgi:Holliday junction resolvase RusA-like endonuclease